MRLEKGPKINHSLSKLLKISGADFNHSAANQSALKRCGGPAENIQLRAFNVDLQKIDGGNFMLTSERINGGQFYIKRTVAFWRNPIRGRGARI